MNKTSQKKTKILYSVNRFAFKHALDFLKVLCHFLIKNLKIKTGNLEFFIFSLSDIKNVLSYAIPYGTVIDDDFQLIMEVM
jgi:hypothetical protein